MKKQTLRGKKFPTKLCKELNYYVIIIAYNIAQQTSEQNETKVR